MKNYIIEKKDFVIHKEQITRFVAHDTQPGNDTLTIIDASECFRYEPGDINGLGAEAENIKIYDVEALSQKKLAKKLKKICDACLTHEHDNSRNLFICSYFQIDAVFRELNNDMVILPMNGDVDAMIRQAVWSAQWKGYLVKCYQRYFFLRGLNSLLQSGSRLRMHVRNFFSYVLHR